MAILIGAHQSDNRMRWATALKSGKDKGWLFVRNFLCFNVEDYIDILIAVHELW